MSSWSNRRTDRSRYVALLGILCILLLLVGVAVQAVHMHEDGNIHGDCVLCVSPQALLAAADCLALLLFLECVLAFIAERKTTYLLRRLPFALCIRPPPDPSAAS